MQRPASGMQLFILDEGGVLFSEERQELLGLNSAATELWCALESGRSPDEVAAELTARANAPAARVSEAIAAVVEDWSRRGHLLPPGSPVGTSPQCPALLERRADVEARECRLSLPRARRVAPGQSVCLALFSSRVALRIGSLAARARVAPVVAHLECDSGPELDAVLEVIESRGLFRLLENAEVAASCESLEEVAPLVQSHLRRLAINGEDYFAELHAGAVVRGNRCVLLPGAPGSGKTTLTAGLVLGGWRYLTDEVSLLDGETLEIRALPLCLSIKPEPPPLLRARFEALAHAPVHRRTDGVRVQYLPPPAEDPMRVERSYAVSAIVFPRFVRGAPAELRPLERATALQRLMEQCLSLPHALERAQVGRLVDWMRRLDCFELQMGRLEDAVERLESLQA